MSNSSSEGTAPITGASRDRDFNLSKGTQAIVIGASMAGMLAARVLADLFDRIIVLERDLLPDRPEVRPGVPQARHLHALLPRGRRILEQNFPGITAELETAGAELLDLANDVAWLTPQGWGVRFNSEFEAVASTRILLDYVVRARLKLIPNIEMMQGCEVTGLVGRAERVEGARLHYRNIADHGRTDVLKSDLVVVATGRNSAVPGWLRDLGLPEPEITHLNAHIGYASQMFRRPEHHREMWKALFIQAAPPSATRAGILFPVEEGRWLVTLQGGDRDYPPLDRAGFLEFARSLRSQALYRAIKDAELWAPSQAIGGQKTSSFTTTARNGGSNLSSCSETLCARSIRSMARA